MVKRNDNDIAKAWQEFGLLNDTKKPLDTFWSSFLSDDLLPDANAVREVAAQFKIDMESWRPTRIPDPAPITPFDVERYLYLLRAARDRRRARELNAPGKYDAKDIALQHKNQRGKCWWCECDLHDGFHVDHLIPLSRGGSNEANNIVLSCPHCNSSKGAKMPWEFIGRLF